MSFSQQCVCTYMYIYIYMYIYTYLHIYKSQQWANIYVFFLEKSALQSVCVFVCVCLRGDVQGGEDS